MVGLGGGMRSVKLREWRGVNKVAGPSGAAITTRLWTTPVDDHVLDLVAEHLGRLRRADLAALTRPETLGPTLDGAAKRQACRDRLNKRKTALTAQSSARWASAIIRVNEDQHRLSRGAQYRHIIGLRAAIAIIEKRLAQPTSDGLTAARPRCATQGSPTEGVPNPGRAFPEAAPAAGATGRARHRERRRG
jgi:hypothetical protein